MNEFFEAFLQADAQLLLAINGLHSAFFDGFMMLSSDKWVWVPFYVSLFYVVLRNCTPRTSLAVLLFAVLTIVFSDQLTAHAMRPMFARLRPTNVANPLSQWVHLVNGYRGGPYSFPSSHAANTTALSFFFVLLFRHRALSWLMAAWTLLVCYSRMYMGVHYPTDIVVGMLVGIVCACITYWCMRWLVKIERLKLSLPSAFPPQGDGGGSSPLVHWYVPGIVLLLTLVAFAIAS